MLINYSNFYLRDNKNRIFNVLQNGKFKMYYVPDMEVNVNVYIPQAADVSTLTFSTSYRVYTFKSSKMWFLKDQIKN